MKLSEEIKEKIKAEHKQWMDTQYAGKSLKERQKLGAFFTPPELAIEMIEKFDNLDGDIFDPCCGSGSTLRAAMELDRHSYGFEIDRNFYERAKNEMLVFTDDGQMDITDFPEVLP